MRDIQRRPSPKANDAFLPISDSPSFQNISESGNIFPTFPKKLAIFHPRKFLLNFFS